jgi:hypothetical protein
VCPPTAPGPAGWARGGGGAVTAHWTGLAAVTAHRANQPLLSIKQGVDGYRCRYESSSCRLGVGWCSWEEGGYKQVRVLSFQGRGEAVMQVELYLSVFTAHLCRCFSVPPRRRLCMAVPCSCFSVPCICSLSVMTLRTTPSAHGVCASSGSVCGVGGCVGEGGVGCVLEGVRLWCSMEGCCICLHTYKSRRALARCL